MTGGSLRVSDWLITNSEHLLDLVGYLSEGLIIPLRVLNFTSPFKGIVVFVAHLLL